jgi:serine/threonine protein kinase
MNLVMELVTGGELFDRIVERGQYTERDAADVIATLCDALNHMHAHNVVHRDLKPENILLSDKSPDAPLKVADFGLARVVSNKDLMRTACGTPGYVAPEVLRNQGYEGGAIDMWSTGVILYILLCGFPPFHEEELPALFDQILRAKFVHGPPALCESCASPARVLPSEVHMQQTLVYATVQVPDAALCPQVRLSVSMVGPHFYRCQRSGAEATRARP